MMAGRECGCLMRNWAMTTAAAFGYHILYHYKQVINIPQWRHPHDVTIITH